MVCVTALGEDMQPVVVSMEPQLGKGFRASDYAQEHALICHRKNHFQVMCEVACEPQVSIPLR